MDEREQETYAERLSYLKTLITGEFPSDNFEISFDPVISVSCRHPEVVKFQQRIPKVEFSMEECFMTDINNGFEKIFRRGVSMAKKILENPPLPDKILQGKIVFLNNGAIFEKRSV